MCANSITITTASLSCTCFLHGCEQQNKGNLTLTYLQHGPEDTAVMRRGAVPPSVPELPLTLCDARSGTPTDATHVVLVQLA
jgi:hypothetical protein